MARRQSGRPVHGWLVLDKPAGPSSAAMVAKARWALAARKAGHAGTLDPAATGVLAIAFGEATKTAAHAVDAEKTYRFAVRWGAATSTDDAEGEVIARSAQRPDPAAIRTALGDFRGDILQIPPAVSAVHVDGKRAYALVRAGQAPELAARPLRVARLDLVATPDPDTAVLEMTCGKGGYVRAVARDLGAALGCLGHVAELRRLRAGPFGIEEAIGIEELERLARTPELEARLLPVTAGLAGLSELPVGRREAQTLANGGAVALPDAGLRDGETAWASAEGRPLALGVWRGGVFRPDRVFVFET
ncbi:tRNA pseudouridine(55) synthase TruB [Amaricoccus sp.]|uniref:tRNA pseudouridine(55) synthase TruB n=1 Tax=Amaricoccus sp. TaxID=1872485 RepID=UPI001B41A7D3|nr:tRNA pseudouridine(55) synthase TruB [Amaricoccus sp.]MBP7240880.1 tRNA pseudouridine(55) synthase TruB [Amaricoccus sp.]